MAINPELHLLAHRKVYGLNKEAQDPMAGMGGGAPPGAAPQGAMPGGPPPGAAPGGPPPGTSSPGQAPPMSPPQMDPAAMIASMGGGGPMQMPQQQQQAPPKLKPEQYMQMLDYRMYNMQQQLTAVINALGVQLPPEALVMPPGTTAAPPPESVMPGSGSPVAR